jgi:hypothetical protein
VVSWSLRNTTELGEAEEGGNGPSIIKTGASNPNATAVGTKQSACCSRTRSTSQKGSGATGMRGEEVWFDCGFPFPLTVIRDRYGGAFSGGVFLAFHLDASNVPYAVFADTITCDHFWNGPLAIEKKNCEADRYLVGIGCSPNEAVENLIIIAQQHNAAFEN